ncbi:hypothetical protein CEXT_90391 [Caerostris extrusa]|uniref:Uncharacterized protein n=1 Tax=Caerostris extrusa TaxID=172846 RepID=A0AAV4Y1T2_CAEEX|nr:hypothetical protein CEXT_90391 [Caerostris extrusa]
MILPLQKMTLPFVDNKEDLYDISRGGGPQCQGVSSPDDRLANDRWGGGQGWPQMARGRLRRLQMFCSRGLYCSLLP